MKCNGKKLALIREGGRAVHSIAIKTRTKSKPCCTSPYQSVHKSVQCGQMPPFIPPTMSDNGATCKHSSAGNQD